VNETLEFKLKNLPDSPGVYQMKSKGELIYVGKAVNLKNRVRQYFQRLLDHTPKVRAMVERVDDFDIILCDTELEALILECNLIKRHKPFYNILLKDDKQYPYIRVDLTQDYPRFEFARRAEKDGARYFGPYFGATVARDVLDLLHKIFPLRNCKLDPRFGAAPPKGFRPCLRAQIGLCLAPCMGRVMIGQYEELVGQALDFLSGKQADLVLRLRAQMQGAAAAMEFERAAALRDRVAAVEAAMEKQKALVVEGEDADILCALPDGGDLLVQVLFQRGGKVLGAERFTMERAAQEEDEGLTMFLLQHYGQAPFIPKEILLDRELADQAVLEQLFSEQRGARVYLRAPKRGEKAKLVALARKNAVDEARKRAELFARQQGRTIGAAKELAAAIGLELFPRRIEGYDISNTQGTNSVASMVVMLNGQAANREYRHFKIKTVVGPNDFASMAEVITRRFIRGERERLEALKAGAEPAGFADLPELVLIDGGPEQLKYALKALHAVPMERYPALFGLAKRFEEIYLPGREDPIRLGQHSEALRLIQRLRDEAHRFAITHHKKLRAKAATRSRLESVPGIGPARRRALLTHFSNMDALSKASVEELLSTPGMSKPSAQAVYDAFHGASAPSHATAVTSRAGIADPGLK
jgi:excinuclease ABC subunit C